MVADTRDRPAEFGERQMIPAAVLLEKLASTLRRSSDVLSRLTEADLRETFHIQGYTVSGLHAVYQVVENWVCTTDRSLTSPKYCGLRILGFTANWIRRAEKPERDFSSQLPQRLDRRRDDACSLLALTANAAPPLNSFGCCCATSW